MAAYYNEIDPYAAQWLRNLIAAGHIADGEVDERSIEDVRPSDLKGFTQCHFFAGIGVWSYALRQAGWSDDREIWTGSCPCQPFSAAGQGKGLADSRHLWPVWMELIATCSPRIIIGEQVASKGVVGHANEGLYGVRGGQTAGSVSEVFRQRKARIEAVMQGVPEGVRKDLALQIDGGAKSHKSQKKPESKDLFEGIQSQEPGGVLDCGVQTKEPEEGICVRLGCICPSDAGAHIQRNLRGIRDCSCVGGCARESLQHPLARQDRPEQRVCLRECSDRCFCGERDAGGLGGGSGDVNHRSVVEKQGVKNDERRTSRAGNAEFNEEAGGAWIDLVFGDLEGAGYACAAVAFPAASVGAPHIRDRLYWVGDSISKGLEGFTGDGELYEWKKPSRPTATAGFQPEPGKPGPTNGFWAEADWLRGQDRLWRPVEPGTSPLADGSPSRVGRLRSYGNAINAEAAKAFIESYLES